MMIVALTERMSVKVFRQMGLTIGVLAIGVQVMNARQGRMKMTFAFRLKMLTARLMSAPVEVRR